MLRSRKKVVVIIPARLNSTRMPQKLLEKIAHKPVIQHVYEKCLAAKMVDEVWIATDSDKILDVAKKFSPRVIITTKKHSSGTSRVSEAADKITSDYVINVQGDEVFIEPELIDKIAVNLVEGKEKAVSAAYLSNDIKTVSATSTAKIVLDEDMHAVYFSRLPIPYNLRNQKLDYWVHIGIYGYSKDFLKKYAAWPKSPLEDVESLEQLKIIYYQAKIKIVPHTKPDGLAIDTPQNLAQAKNIIGKKL